MDEPFKKEKKRSQMYGYERGGSSAFRRDAKPDEVFSLSGSSSDELSELLGTTGLADVLATGAAAVLIFLKGLTSVWEGGTGREGRLEGAGVSRFRFG